MGRDNNTYAKRQREILKKQKAEDKKARRLRRKNQTGIISERRIDDMQTVDPSVPSVEASEGL